MKPPLTYFGGKQQLAKYILPLIPKHTLYCEPFFGGGAIFFTKSPSEIEVINDSNGELINFYRIVKRNCKELEREVKVTLHSRQFHQTAKVVLGFPELFTEVKRAWAIWMLANDSYSSRLDSSWGTDRKKNTSVKRLHYKRQDFTSVYAERLEKTEIENADALKVIQSRDTRKSFFYLDPPYFNANRGHYKPYTEEDFEKLLDILSTLKGKFLLSSYPSPLLERFVKKNKWCTQNIERPLAISAKYKGNRMKIEMLTANYPI